MEITDKKQLKDLQEEFNRQFPYLHLEFYRSSHKPGEPSNEKDTLTTDQLVGDIREVHNSGNFKIDGNMKVGDFEQLLRKLFGLNAQVKRKSYGKWLQTWATDVWSLNEQNRRGQILGNR